MTENTFLDKETKAILKNIAKELEIANKLKISELNKEYGCEIDYEDFN